jgi:hypothetical protein
MLHQGNQVPASVLTHRTFLPVEFDIRLTLTINLEMITHELMKCDPLTKRKEE